VSQTRFLRNCSQADDIREHLFACDSAFSPLLSSRVFIPDYAAQLFARAERFEAWAGPRLIGLVAVYCNDQGRREAFVSSVSVSVDWARRGIARRLLQEAIAEIRDRGFGRLALSVDRSALALRLYRGLGFEVEECAGEALRLSLGLREDGGL
jgi:ribosomal protein S18 acetylase RimI-like enzyme